MKYGAVKDTNHARKSNYQFTKTEGDISETGSGSKGICSKPVRDELTCNWVRRRTNPTIVEELEQRIHRNDNFSGRNGESQAGRHRGQDKRCHTTAQCASDEDIPPRKNTQQVHPTIDTREPDASHDNGHDKRILNICNLEKVRPVANEEPNSRGGLTGDHGETEERSAEIGTLEHVEYADGRSQLFFLLYGLLDLKKFIIKFLLRHGIAALNSVETLESVIPIWRETCVPRHDDRGSSTIEEIRERKA